MVYYIIERHKTSIGISDS